MRMTPSFSSCWPMAVVSAGTMIHPEAVVTVLIQSLTHSKPSTVSCNTFLLNLNNSIRITSHSLIACTFPFMVEPNTALFWFSCQSLSVPVYIFTASHVDVLFDSVPCLWSQFLRFVIVSIGPSHLKWAQTRIQMIYLESLGAHCAQVTPITPRGMIVKRKSWQEIFNKLHDISIWVWNIGRVWSLYPHLDPIVITLRNNGTMKRRGSR